MVAQDAIRQVADEVTQPLIEGLQLRVGQQIRQFHRIGRSRTAGCRRVAERSLRDALETVRDEVVAAVAETDPERLADPATVQLVTDRLELCATAFEERFRAVLRQTEGYSEAAVERAVQEVAATVEDALTAAEAASSASALPSFEWLAEPDRTQAVAWARAASRALAADAAPAAAVSAARALALVGAATGADGTAVAERAAARGVTPEDLDPQAVLERDPVPDESLARSLLELIEVVADQRSDG
jgi:type IV secretory pathway VirJ component